MTALDLIVAARRPHEWEGDRYMEAVLGARLRFHVADSRDTRDAAWQRYWIAVYGRWAALYRAGKAGRLASWPTVCPEPGCTAASYPHDPDDHGHPNPCGCDWTYQCDAHRRPPMA